MKIVIAAVLFTLLIFSPTQASLIDHGNFTTDDVSGLDWLDTALTDGMSYKSVTANYQTAIAIVRDSVIPVPEPSAILLFGIGMLGLARINRKKYKNLSK